jgi:hypothetical protein
MRRSTFSKNISPPWQTLPDTLTGDSTKGNVTRQRITRRSHDNPKQLVFRLQFVY